MNDLLTVSQSFVGINTTDPGGLLNIQDDDSTTNLFAISSTSDGDYFVVKNTGNVGIGTTGPVALLDVNADVSNNTTAMRVYDSGGNLVLELDEGSSPIYWQQGLSSQFIQGTFYQTVTSSQDDHIYLEEDAGGKYYTSGEYISVIRDTKGVSQFDTFRAITIIPSSTKIVAHVQVSDDNFATIKDSIDFDLTGNLQIFDALSALANGRYIRVKLDFQTQDISVTPHLVSFEVWYYVIESASENADTFLTLDALSNDSNATKQDLVVNSNATYDSLIVNGNVGIGTTSPDAILHTNKSGLGDQEVARFSAPSGDPYVTIGNGITSTTGGYLIWRDASDYLGMGIHGADPVLSIKGGNVGIGDTTPDYKLDVEGNAATFMLNVYNDGGSADRYGIRTQTGTDDGSGTSYVLGVYDGDGDLEGGLRIVAGTFALYNNSDIRLKQNIRDTEINGLDIINKLRVRDFEFKKLPEIQKIGFVAQEVQEVYPYAVSEDGDKEKLLGISKELFVPVLVKAIQEQQGMISSLVDNLFIDENGGLEVAGDIAATGFINISTEERDIEYLEEDDEQEILSKIASTSIARYLYKDEVLSSNSFKRLGLIAEQAPEEILSADGKGIDLYKMNTFTLAGLKALEAKVNSIAQTGQTVTDFIQNTSSQILDTIEAGLVRAYKIVVDDLIVGKILANKIAVEDSIISKGITKFVHLVKGGVDAITGEDYEGKLDEYEGDEFTLGSDEQGYISYSLSSNKKEIQISGFGQVADEAKIKFHPAFSAIISDTDPYRVIITPTGPPTVGIYVAEKNQDGFLVKTWAPSPQDATASQAIPFDWIVIASLRSVDNSNDANGDSDATNTTDIYNISVSEIDVHSAVISWHTNVDSDTLLKYGLSIPAEGQEYDISIYGDSSVDNDLFLHTVRLTGLEEGTTHHFRVSSSDNDGNTVQSEDLTFTTIAPEPEPEPEIPDCIDPEATNYNPEATVDDGSCEYAEQMFYLDFDEDGWGDIASFTYAFEQPEDYVVDNNDCDDSDFDINPAVADICWDNIDNNCDGQIDENCSYGTNTCDTSINLVGECVNSADDLDCEPACFCADGFNDCNNDPSDGCETEGECSIL